MITRRVHVSQPYDVYMGRDCAGLKDVGWGNPFPLSLGREQCLAAYQYHLRSMPNLKERLEGLRGKRLACWCKADEACHVDIVLNLIREFWPSTWARHVYSAAGISRETEAPGRPIGSFVGAPPGCLPAYQGCTCSCHSVPGVMHCVPCCYPEPSNAPPSSPA